MNRYKVNATRALFKDDEVLFAGFSRRNEALLRRCDELGITAAVACPLMYGVLRGTRRKAGRFGGAPVGFVARPARPCGSVV